VISIDEAAFQECWKLNYLRIPKNLEEFSTYVFKECFDLRTISDLESSKIRIIEKYAFSQCKKLEEICFPDTLKKILANAFSSCEKLKNVKFNSRPEVANSAFTGCIYTYPSSMELPIN
jgi:hypothetical protein